MRCPDERPLSWALALALLAAQPACSGGAETTADSESDGVADAGSDDIAPRDAAPDARDVAAADGSGDGRGVPDEDLPADTAELADSAADTAVWSPYHAHVDLDLPGPAGSVDRVDVADPTVIKVGPTWYLYGTHNERNLESWSSDDLETWRYEGVIWEPTLGSWNDHPAIWAPHVQRAPSGYYLYYTANGRVGLAVSGGPTGPFVDVRPVPFAGGGAGGIGDGVYQAANYDVTNTDHVMPDAEEYAIDAFVLEAADGSLTFYCAVLRPWSVIAAIPMVDYTTLADVPPVIVLDMDTRVAWEALNREGPWVIEREGRFLMFYSGNYWWTTNYAVGVATAETPLGPFVRQSAAPVLERDLARGILGPGHNSVAPGFDDDLLIFYHNKVDTGDYSARRTRLAPLEFDEVGRVSVE